MKGGYKIINLKGAQTGQTIPGIYDAVENNFGKALLLTGVAIDGIDYPEEFVNAEEVTSNAFGFRGSRWGVIINEDDTVEVYALPSPYEKFEINFGNVNVTQDDVYVNFDITPHDGDIIYAAGRHSNWFSGGFNYTHLQDNGVLISSDKYIVTKVTYTMQADLILYTSSLVDTSARLIIKVQKSGRVTLNHITLT